VSARSKVKLNFDNRIIRLSKSAFIQGKVTLLTNYHGHLFPLSATQNRNFAIFLHILLSQVSFWNLEHFNPMLGQEADNMIAISKPLG